MQSRKVNQPCFTVRKVTDNHWGLVFMGCPARSSSGQVFRFRNEHDAAQMARQLNERETSGFLPRGR